jgi:hypothetical protein
MLRKGNFGMTDQPQADGARQDWAEYWAKDFHDTYERAAPSFGYETRKESAKPWGLVPKKNRELMVAVVAEVLCRFQRERDLTAAQSLYHWHDVAQWFNKRMAKFNFQHEWTVEVLEKELREQFGGEAK